MAKIRLFKSNKTQAVRLPKSVAFDPGIEEVEIFVVGESRIITPANRSWAAWFAGEGVSGDFMVQREQPDPQERDTF